MSSWSSSNLVLVAEGRPRTCPPPRKSHAATGTARSPNGPRRRAHRRVRALVVRGKLAFGLRLHVGTGRESPPVFLPTALAALGRPSCRPAASTPVVCGCTWAPGGSRPRCVSSHCAPGRCHLAALGRPSCRPLPRLLLTLCVDRPDPDAAPVKKMISMLISIKFFTRCGSSDYHTSPLV